MDELPESDALPNIAAMPKRRHVIAITPDDVTETMRVNFESPVRRALARLPWMLAREDGMIGNVSSFGGRVGILDEAARCASKFALCGWTEAMAMDLWHHPVDVRLIFPGAVDTEIWDRAGSAPAVYDGSFESLPIAEFKTADIEGFLAGAVAFADERRRAGGQ